MSIALYDSDPVRRHKLLDVDTSGFVEPDLAYAMRSATLAKRLQVVDQLVSQTFPAHYIICVPTPIDEAGELVVDALYCTMQTIFEIAQADDAIFIRSTVPIGTTRRLAASARARGLDLRFASTPDRSIEGRSFADQFVVPQLIGAVDEQAAERAKALFASVGEVIDLACAEAAEAAKLFTNAWRITLFATSNAMAMACESHGLNVHAIFAATSSNYPRFSPPRPGPVGGPCLPKDISLLAASVPAEAGAIFRAVSESEVQLIAQVGAALDAHLVARQEPLRVALLGIAFKGKPEVDDVRGSVALGLVRHLRGQWPDAVLVGWDAVMTTSQIAKTGLIPAASLWDAANGASLVVICNDHPALVQFELESLASTMAKGALIYDLFGATLPFRAALPNQARHHILGCGTY